MIYDAKMEQKVGSRHINFQNNVSPKLNNVSPNTDSHRATDPF